MAVSGECGEIRTSAASNWSNLREDWRRLHAASDNPTFFLSPLWMDAWLEVFGPELSPNFISYTNKGCLQGVVLLSFRRLSQGPFRLREAHLNTAGEGADSPFVEHNVMLCAPEHRNGFGESLVKHVLAQGWDELVFDGIRSTDFAILSPLCGVPSQETWRDSPYVDLQIIRDRQCSFLDTLSSNTRQKIRRSIRLFEERGPIAVEYADSNEAACEYFEELVQLHQASWNARGKPGAFASDRLKTFHSFVIKQGKPNLDYQLIRITCGSDTVGVIYNLLHDKHISYYQSGFSYQSDNRLKPGLVCHALVIQKALDAGYAEYDLLATAGDWSQYKSSLSNAERKFGWITYTRDSAKMRALKTLRSIRGGLKR